VKAYETAAGLIVRTQDEAKASGKGWRLVEIPTDQRGLIDYLNNNRHIPCDCNGSGVKEAAPVVTQERAPSREPVECSRCKWDLRSRQRYADRIERDLTIEGVEQWIDKCEPNYLTKLVSAVTLRLSELARGL
jgi:hypothetical protein